MDKMFGKKTSYTIVTPIPSQVPRQLAIDMLQSHGEIIELNPLVTGFEAIKAPRNAPADEFYASWYEISQKIQFIPGIGKMGSAPIKFNGVFHDMPWGLQTHTYAPAGVDLRVKWQICGNQPGEPPQPQELGLGAPPEGLYLREDIEIKCNVTMVSFVKKETKEACKVLVDRLIKKAELLDAGVLQAMMENGKLKTFNPADKRDPGQKSPQPSPSQSYNMPMSPTRASVAYSPGLQQQQYSPGQQHPQQFHGQGGAQYVPPEHLLGQNTVVMELPGDFTYNTINAQPSPSFLAPDSKRTSTASSHTTAHSPSHPPADARWSQASGMSAASSRPTSYAPSEGMRSPGLEQKGFAAELPTMEETREEHESRRERESNVPGGGYKYVYNPQDYARTQAQYESAPPYQQGGFAQQGGYAQGQQQQQQYGQR